MRARTIIWSVVAIMAIGIGAWPQGAKKMDMNETPYANVKAMLATPEGAAKARQMAKANGVMLMGGMPINGQAVTLKGELTGADCYLSGGLHGHEHALCSKACVAHGSPILFVAHGGGVYVVLTPKDGRPFPEDVLNALGKPSVTVQGNTLDSQGVKAISIHSVS